ncbi:Optic atrophy 3-like [Babesia duncani]|uniref:Optic atrophy 3-like n=1 Tax=Babesia duncani TaxID=323732 RepID=A0AAD9PM22_9APIC|nr:Optic atrophy 3-like [Babesia duncani]
MFPAYKVLSVFVKQVSKPLASYLKRRASVNPKFRRLCICFGNASYKFDRYITRRFYSPETVESGPIATISEETSIAIGTELFGECIIFTVAVLLIVAEYTRGVRKDNLKEKTLQQRLEALEIRQERLFDYLKLQDAKPANA